MEPANLVTYPELFQVLGIFSGIWLAILSIAVAWYIRDTNRRDLENDRRHKETESNNEHRHQETENSNERRHQYLLKAISLLYQHSHADGSPAIVPWAGIAPAAAPVAADG